METNNLYNDVVLFSIFTPFHKKDTKFLLDAYESIKEQTYTDFEWVLIPNGDGLEVDTEFLEEDDRVKVFPCYDKSGKVGTYKQFACQQATGDYLVELDFDDLLTPDCLEVLKSYIDKEHPDFLFSTFAQVDLKGDTAGLWSNYYGWEYKDFDYKGKTVKQVISPLFEPQNFSRIWFAPNHVRVWRREFYHQIGGHNPAMEISDDHDLVSRSYLDGKCLSIPECLYVYRVHEKNTTWLLNKEIQDTQWDNYNKYIYKLINKWADERQLKKVDLGGGLRPFEGYETVDLFNPATHKADLNERWPFEDNSVGVFRAMDIVEHLKDPIHTMNEAYRCLADGGFLMIDVPSTDGRGAFQDPTHVSFWNENSFNYYTRADTFEYIKHQANCKFQAMRVLTYFPNDWCKKVNLPYVAAHLFAVKGPRKYHGYYDW